MEVRRWQAESVDRLSETIGRQMLNTEHLTVARILLRAGAVVPAHAHVNEQVSTVLEGSARFVIDGEEVVLAPGESVSIPPHVPHEVTALEDTVALDVFSPRREDWISGDDAYLRG